MARGGWYALEKEAVAAVGRAKLAAYYRDLLPTTTAHGGTFDAEAVGGWTLLEQVAAAEPKDLLVQYMTAMTQSGQTTASRTNNVNQLLDAIAALLYAQGQGYNAELVGTSQ